MPHIRNINATQSNFFFLYTFFLCLFIPWCLFLVHFAIIFLCLSLHFLLSLFSFMSFFFRHHPWCFVISFVLTDSFFFSTSVFLHLFFSLCFLYIQGVSPHWGVMLTQAPIWGNRGWETKFLFHAPVSLDWGTFRLTPLCTFPNFPRLCLRVGVALFHQIGVVLRRKV